MSLAGARRGPEQGVATPLPTRQTRRLDPFLVRHIHHRTLAVPGRLSCILVSDAHDDALRGGDDVHGEPGRLAKHPLVRFRTSGGLGIRIVLHYPELLAGKPEA